MSDNGTKEYVNRLWEQIQSPLLEALERDYQSILSQILKLESDVTATTKDYKAHRVGTTPAEEPSPHYAPKKPARKGRKPQASKAERLEQ